MYFLVQWLRVRTFGPYRLTLSVKLSHSPTLTHTVHTLTWFLGHELVFLGLVPFAETSGFRSDLRRVGTEGSVGVCLGVLWRPDLINLKPQALSASAVTSCSAWVSPPVDSAPSTQELAPCGPGMNPKP